MDIGFEISDEKRLIVARVLGDISLETIEKAIDNLLQYPKFDPDYKILVDVQNATKAPELNQMKAIAELLFRQRKQFRSDIAIVVNPEIARKTSVVCYLVRPFGINMEAYGDAAAAEAFLTTGQCWQKD